MGMTTPYLLGIVSAIEKAAVRTAGYAFPALAGLGKIIERFFSREARS